MISEKKTVGTITLLNWHYWANIIFLVTLFLLVQTGIFPFFSDAKNVSVTLERYDIIILIIAVPLSLKLFADNVKKLARPVNIESAIRIYKKASYMRLYTLSVITVVQIFLFGYSHHMNFFWLTIVLFITFLFCKPSYAELANMIETSYKGDMEDENHEELNPEATSTEKKETEKQEKLRKEN